MGERQEVQHTNASPTRTVSVATILMICFIAEHNLPFAIADHLVELCKVMFPDSSIAQGLCMKRTKCTEVAKTIGTCLTSALVSKLRKQNVSVIIDESTDASTSNCMCVIVNYYDKDASTINTETLQLIDIYGSGEENVGSTGENSYARLMKTRHHYYQMHMP